jgi:dephospho-CoA kinase
VVFIDGIRSYSEIKMFKKEFDEFYCIAITVDDKLRFERISARGRNDDPKSLKELKKRDERELQFGLKKVIQNADFQISNKSSKSDLKEKVKQCVDKLLAG